MKKILGFNNKFARNKLVTAMALAQNEFNPRSAFAGGEQGIWLDPNDVSAAKLRWRRNLLTYTEQFSSSAWSKGGTVSITPNVAVAPDGTQTADQISFAAAFDFAQHAVTSVAAGEVMCASIYAKRNSGTIGFRLQNSASTVFIKATIDTSARTLTSRGTASATQVSLSVEAVNAEWDRYIIVGSLSVATTNAGIMLVREFTGETGAIVWGAQFERGSAPTAYQALTDVNSEFLQAFPNHALFQDAAGTIPVTAAGQPVGLVLDKRLGLVRGPELYTFANVGSPVGSTIAQVGTGFSVTDSDPSTRAYLNLTTVAGAWYEVKYSLAGGQVNVVYARDGANGAGTILATASDPHRRLVFQATGVTSSILWDRTSAGNFTITDLTVRELPGNHAFQTTAASRPLFKTTPILGPELVTNGGFASDSSWVKNTGWTIFGGSAVATAAPAYSIIGQSIPLVAGRSYEVTFTVQTASAGSVRCIMYGGPDTVGTARAAAGTYSQVLVAASGNVSFGIQALASGFTGTVDNISVREITGYYTDRNYLEFDGVDDFLVTNNIDFTGTDKVTVFAGVRKSSDSASAALCELSPDPGTVNGTFGILAPGFNGQNKFVFSSRGVTANTVYALTTATAFSAPVAVALGGVGNISGDSTILRLNGAQVVQATSDQGTGNYGNYPLYIGRRAGSSLPFNGWLYSLIIKGALSSSAEIASIERTLFEKISDSISYEPTLSLNFVDQRYSIKV